MNTRRPGSRVATPVPAENGSPDGGHNSVTLGPRDRLIGKLYVEGDVHVSGTVEGALEVTGDVEISGGGQVSGPVTARKRLRVGSEGSLRGDVRVARLVIEDGASFSGNVQMGKAFEALPVEPAAAVVAEPEPEVPEPQPIEIKLTDPKKKRR
ncbi:MAG TPA: polymer-forming cytoskeletal protein [Candidatus Dormibacteraeota bacterium]|nr:polymer-forming cytoskeletal protein [Candidatus Dormibacteraeota bacterium]